MRVTVKLSVQRLDRYFANSVTHLLLGEIDLPHAAFADELHHSVSIQNDFS